MSYDKLSLCWYYLLPWANDLVLLIDTRWRPKFWFAHFFVFAKESLKALNINDIQFTFRRKIWQIFVFAMKDQKMKKRLSKLRSKRRLGCPHFEPINISDAIYVKFPYYKIEGLLWYYHFKMYVNFATKCATFV